MSRLNNTPWLVSGMCNYCGDHQISPTAFSSIVRLSEPVIDLLDPIDEVGCYYEITVCESCLFSNFGGSISRAVIENKKSFEDYILTTCPPPESN